MGNFRSVSIVLPVLNETRSLEKTVEVIEGTCDARDIEEYIIVVCDRTTPEAVSACQRLKERLDGRASIHNQKLPFIGGAMREAFDLARGSHTVMMSSDLETDPAVIRVFIEAARKKPDAIITASRWIEGGGFQGYHPMKLAANFLFQKIFAILYGVRLTDLTYAYRIFPSALLKSIAWEELKHPFFLETVIKPLRLGVEVIEVPALWKARAEGNSVNPFLSNFAYFRIALKVRVRSRERILK